jgi:hypothetical protein
LVSGLRFLLVKRYLTESTGAVYTGRVRNITLSAEEELINKARVTAQVNNTTLNAAFRAWLEEYTSSQDRVEQYKALMLDLRHVRSHGPYSRDEMNER